jgi:hypothetical protein
MDLKMALSPADELCACPAAAIIAAPTNDLLPMSINCRLLLDA